MPIGVVEKVNKKFVTVHIDRQDMCGECHACDMVHPAKKCTLKCVDTISSQVGDQVLVSIEEQTFLKATYIMYGFPFIGFVLGLGLGWFMTKQLNLANGDLLTVSLALLGALIMLGIIYWRDKNNAYHKYLPKIISKIETSHKEK